MIVVEAVEDDDDEDERESHWLAAKNQKKLDDHRTWLVLRGKDVL